MAEERFSFGKNWSDFGEHIDERHVEGARRALIALLDRSSLAGAEMLDIGCGSGLMSLAAVQLGARVTSFDYDADAVEVTRRLRAACANPDHWRVLAGSVLDETFMRELGNFDLVYSWGVLHHTGRMWEAIDIASRAVRPGGVLAIALYNDQGWMSRMWLVEKRIYCSGTLGRRAMLALWGPAFALGWGIADMARGRSPLARYDASLERGMRAWTDLKDWLGGLPFEVAAPNRVREFLAARGFTLERQNLTRGLGCNEFVFRRSAAEPPR